LLQLWTAENRKEAYAHNSCARQKVIEFEKGIKKKELP
jgi:hypothetical protein